jgi:hypothetical protein
MTDRGVGDGSTVSAIQAAYAGDSTITREPSLGGHETLRVQPNDPGAGQFLAFQVDGDTAGQPHVGRTPGSEGCRLATATPSATPGPQQCGLYKTDQGDYALVVQSGSASCDTARTLFDRMFRGEGKSLSRQSVQIDDYKCTGNSAGAFDETGVLSYCEQVGIRIQLRKP